MDDKVYLAYYELIPFYDHQFKIIGVSRTYEGAERLIELWLANHPFEIDDTLETVDIYEIILDDLF